MRRYEGKAVHSTQWLEVEVRPINNDWFTVEVDGKGDWAKESDGEEEGIVVPKHRLHDQKWQSLDGKRNEKSNGSKLHSRSEVE